MIEEPRLTLLSCVALPDNDKRAKGRKSNTNNNQYHHFHITQYSA